MYQIKLGINNKAPTKPKPPKVYAGVEDKYRKKGSWDCSTRPSRSLLKGLRSQQLPRARSGPRPKRPRASEIKELSLNNFDSLTGFENVFNLISKQKQLMALEVD